MKRRDLVRQLESVGFSLIRTNGPHDVFSNGTLKTAVPRHREIKEYLARKILKEAGL